MCCMNVNDDFAVALRCPLANESNFHPKAISIWSLTHGGKAVTFRSQFPRYAFHSVTISVYTSIRTLQSCHVGVKETWCLFVLIWPSPKLLNISLFCVTLIPFNTLIPYFYFSPGNRDLTLFGVSGLSIRHRNCSSWTQQPSRYVHNSIRSDSIQKTGNIMSTRVRESMRDIYFTFVFSL